MFQFITQCRQKFFFRYFFVNFSMFDNQTLADTSGNPDIGFLCLSRSVYHTSHYRHFDIKRKFRNHRFYLIGKPDQINAGSSAGRTGNNFHAAFSESQSPQDQLCTLYFLHRITGQGDTDRIADPLMENNSKSTEDLILPESNVPDSVIPTWSG